MVQVTDPISSTGAAATPAPVPVELKPHGSVYFSWGYNRDWYTRSDIRFKNTTTANYDFTFLNAHASDKPDFKDFWRFNSWTIPQYDMTLGYLFHDKHNLGIEVSWNHLKYVVDDNQVMHVRGQINGRQIDKDTLVTPDFVHLQHTNGNNYLMVNLVKHRTLFERRYFKVSAVGKVGLGPMISYTISTVLGDHEEGPFHYHGMVMGTSLGLKADILRYFFLQTDIQGAFADYTNTWLGQDRVGRATHTFGSLQAIWAFGFNVPL
ncbi:hypothetical protein [Hymenobacter rubidus]|uniref:hypothetical protein n=1 Tax=Hymenobacter rubidus TaxID=1441626 RepID=UPI001F2C5ABD|nr:hypothetical protein [Hymenobacter rubidus]